MPFKIAGRAGVPPFHVLEILRQANEREAAGARILHLEAGQPSAAAPAAVRQAVAASLNGERHGYTEALGKPALRRRIAHHYQEQYGIDIAPHRVAVTMGSSAAFQLAFLTAFEPGDRVALAAPGYPAYRNILQSLDLVPVEIETGPETKFQPDPARLDRLEGPIAGLIVASPSNPTGTILEPDSLAALAAWCETRGVRLISDEIYHRTGFAGGEATAASHAPNGIVINSFSKYYCMTGWRLGWAVLPEDMVRPVELLAQSLYIAPPSPAQTGAITAFDCSAELDAHVQAYRHNRDRLIDALAPTRISVPAAPEGAFYLYADIAGYSLDSSDFAARLLAEAGVALTPGIDFDPRRGGHTIRLSYAGSAADVSEAGQRIAAWLR